MRIAVIGPVQTGRRFSEAFGAPFFRASANLDERKLDELCASSAWIAVLDGEFWPERLFERADAVVIRSSGLGLGGTKALPPERMLWLRQRCARLAVARGDGAAIRWIEAEGLADAPGFIG